jgi:hypothetical protein
MRPCVRHDNECGRVAAGSVMHDAYRQGLDRLLGEQRVEKT